MININNNSIEDGILSEGKLIIGKSETTDSSIFINDNGTKGSLIGSIIKGYIDELHKNNHISIENAFGATATGLIVDSSNSYISARSDGVVVSGVVENSSGGCIDASGAGSHIHGYVTNGGKIKTTQNALGSYAEGYVNNGSILVNGNGSHAEGYVYNGNIEINGNGSHAEGYNTKALNNYIHVEGSLTIGIGVGSHAEGGSTTNSFIRSTYAYYTWQKNTNYIIINNILYAESFMKEDTHLLCIIKLGNNNIIYIINSYLYIYGSNTIKIQLNLNKTISESNGSGYIYYSLIGAIGDYSHTEGYTNTAFGYASHAEGNFTLVYGMQSHAEGNNSKVIDTLTYYEETKEDYIYYSVNPNSNNITIQFSNNTFDFTKALVKINNNKYASVLNWYYDEIASDWIHLSLDVTLSNDDYNWVHNMVNEDAHVIIAHKRTMSSCCAHAEGYNTVANASCAHAEGYDTSALGGSSHAEGSNTIASGGSSHAEGAGTRATSTSHAEGTLSTASGYGSHAEGRFSIASGESSHAEGRSGNATAEGAHSEGYDTDAMAKAAHAEGNHSYASAEAAHAEGYNTKALNNYSHAEGDHTTANGVGAHAEGYKTVAAGIASHAGGINSSANGGCSFAHGENVIADTSHAVVFGKNNYINYNNIDRNYIFTVGCGKSKNTSYNGLEVLEYNYGDGYHRTRTTIKAEYVDAVGGNSKYKETYVITDEYLTLGAFLNNKWDGNWQNKYANTTADNYISLGWYDIDFIHNGITTYNFNCNNGTATATGGWTTTSDKRKKDIKHELDLERCYNLIDKCSEIVFKWKDKEDSKEEIGMIAQEVQEFFPEIVNTDKDGYLSLDYSKLSIICLRVLKDLIKDVKELKDKNNS